ncbi:late embryogenesis abundant protein Lea5-like [Lotus japonicus]|uniref:late embryogenesis abundant protein Lea5-like n=1 Tax=Lotus japonicus TaxID=34305 RepID=UPI0025842EBA|nr:late embryogenesis abundant protein Lea5-like [Lotus japonicus]
MAARSFSQQLNRVLNVNALSFPLHRRGYAVACDVSGSRKVVVEETKTDSEASSSAWAPDPVTGYYRPINRMNEVDPVELRNMLLNPTVRKSQSSSTSP